MNETQVTIVGNAVEDPVVRFGKTGQQFVTFRLASTVRRRDGATGGFVDVGTNFVTVLAFRQLGQNVAVSIRKGQPVVVSGRLRVNQWSAGDRSGTSVEIDASAVGHDLTRGRADFTRVKTGTFGEGSFPAGAPSEASGALSEASGTSNDAAGSSRDVAFGGLGGSLQLAEARRDDAGSERSEHSAYGLQEPPLDEEEADGPLPPYEEQVDRGYAEAGVRLGA